MCHVSSVSEASGDPAETPSPSFVPSLVPHLVEPLQWRQNLKFDGGGEMITAESEAEKRERQHREREAMRQAIAAYTGPITKCPKAGAISAAAQTHAALWPPMRSL